MDTICTYRRWITIRTVGVFRLNTSTCRLGEMSSMGTVHFFHIPIIFYFLTSVILHALTRNGNITWPLAFALSAENCQRTKKKMNIRGFMQCNKLTHIKLLTYHPDTAHICFDTEITTRLLVNTTNACGKPSMPENI